MIMFAIAALLPHRGTIRLFGPDRLSFLQNLVSNDVTQAANGIYAALLTPQGKFLHDMFILDRNDSFLIDCERADDLLRRLSAYKLRAKVTLENLSNRFDVWAVWNGNYIQPFSFVDRRLPQLGTRAFIPKGETPPDVTMVDFAAYDLHRLSLGIGDGSRDMEIEKSTLAEGNFDFLNGIDWKKGCYVGQELTARMHYRGLAKKRLFPVIIEGDAPAFGAVFDGDSGEMRSFSGKHGLALLRIESAKEAIDQKKPLTRGNTRLYPSLPDWMKIDVSPTNR